METYFNNMPDCIAIFSFLFLLCFFLHIARRSELHSVLKEKKRMEIKVGYKCTEMECRRMFCGGVAAVKGFKDLTIPHPLSLSFISNNQAWPQNIPLDRVERARVRGERKKKTCCLSASHSSLGYQSWVFLLKSSVTFMASYAEHSLFFFFFFLL